jgi:hypothetical protein
VADGVGDLPAARAWARSQPGDPRQLRLQRPRLLCAAHHPGEAPSPGCCWEEWNIDCDCLPCGPMHCFCRLNWAIGPRPPDRVTGPHGRASFECHGLCCSDESRNQHTVKWKLVVRHYNKKDDLKRLTRRPAARSGVRKVLLSGILSARTAAREDLFLQDGPQCALVPARRQYGRLNGFKSLSIILHCQDKPEQDRKLETPLFPPIIISDRQPISEQRPGKPA